MKIWRLIMDRIFEMEKDIIDNIYGVLSFKPPYSATVTTVLRCYTKIEYDVRFRRIEMIPTRFSTVLGIIFDYTVKNLLKDKGFEEKRYSKKYVDDEGNEYVIYGDPDLVMGDEVVELKYTSMPLENLPLEHHVYQVKMYMNQSGLNGRLIYFTPNGVREFLYDREEALTDEEIAGIARSFFIDKVSPRYDWECQYCHYRSICPLAVLKTEEEEK